MKTVDDGMYGCTAVTHIRYLRLSNRGWKVQIMYHSMPQRTSWGMDREHAVAMANKVSMYYGVPILST